MLTLNQFINQWNGKKLEFDGAFLYQCVDLVKAWNANLGYPPKWGNGKDWINNAGNEYIRVDYSPGKLPQAGDIFSFKATTGNPGGHTGVVIASTPTAFTSFDQNFPVGSPCHVQPHDYKLMLGWIHPKNGGDDNMIVTRQILEAMVFAYDLRSPNETEYSRDVGRDYMTVAALYASAYIPKHQQERNDAALVPGLQKQIDDAVAVTPDQKAFIDSLKKII